jgi:hypothetical protein
MSGLAISPFYGSPGIWDIATGVDFFRYPGLLAAGYEPTNIGTGLVDRKVKFILPFPSYSSVFAIGTEDISLSESASSFRIYKIVPQTDDVSIVHSASSYAIYGADIFQGEIVYTNSNDIGISNSSSLHWDDDGVGANKLESGTYFHDVKVGPDDKCYIADVNNLHQWDGSTLVEDKLSLPSTYFITSLGNDGYYLLIGASQVPYSGRAGNSRLYFWDCWSVSNNKYWDIPENPIRGIVQNGGYTYIFAGSNVYRCTSDTPPKVVFGNSMTNASVTPYVGATIGNWRDSLLWGDNNNGFSYGSSNLLLNQIISSPINTSSTDTIYGTYGAFYNKVYVGAGKKLLAYKTGTRSATAKTILLDIPKSHITGLKVIMENAGTVTAEVQDRDGNAILSETITDTKHIMKQGSESVIADQVIISLAFTNATIKRIELYGIPLSE